MEQYTKNMMLKKYNQYLTFLAKQERKQNKCHIKNANEAIKSVKNADKPKS